MHADFPVVLDACVLANFGLCDLLLRLAEGPRLYLPRWSAETLDEVVRTQRDKLDWPEHLAAHWRHEVERSFPEARVDGLEPLIEQCGNHPKDRHVLAAAVRTGAELIVTFNLKDFPAAALAPWKVSATHPQEFLITLYTLSPGVVVTKLERIARERKRAPEAQLAHLGKSLPAFTQHVADDLGWELPAP